MAQVDSETTFDETAGPTWLRRRVRGEGGGSRGLLSASDLHTSYDDLHAAATAFEAPLCLALFVSSGGPRVGRDVACLADELRPDDRLGAWDQGRLVLLLPGTPPVGARRVVQRLSERLASWGGSWTSGVAQVRAGQTLEASLEAASKGQEPASRSRSAEGGLTPGGMRAVVEWAELCDLLLWLGRCGRSGRLLLGTPEGRGGVLVLRAGRVVGALTSGGQPGREAALATLDVGTAEIELLPARELESPALETADAFDASPTELLLEVARRRDESALGAMPAAELAELLV